MHTLEGPHRGSYQKWLPNGGRSPIRQECKDKNAEKANDQGASRNTRDDSVRTVMGGPFVRGQDRSAMKRYVREA